MLLLQVGSLDATHDVAATIADLARAGDVIVLSGEMGAGKTAFAKGFGAALGVTEPITSPTFTLVNSYDCPPPNRVTLHHADLYRLERTGEVADLALAELADMDGIVLVEWGDVVESTFGDHLHVHLEFDDADDEHDHDETDETDDTGGGPGSGRGDAESWELPASTGRLIEIAGVGPSWAARWERLAAALRSYAC